jgi:hypothetical protein
MLRVRAVLCLAVVLMVCGAAAWLVARFVPDDDLPPYQPVQIIGPQSPHVAVPTRRTQDVRPGEIGDDELVLGVELGGQARAYPINQLSGPRREAFNETLGGRAIAVTWCDLCHTGIVYSREVQDRTLTFYICGKLWHNTAILMDVETGSEWSHLLGRAMKGPLQDTRLSVVPSVILTWKQWKAHHPRTTVSVLGRTTHEYSPAFYADPGPFAVGLREGSESVSYTFAQLHQEIAINDVFNSQPILIGFDRIASGAVAYSRELDGQVLEFEAVGRELVGGGSRWNLTTGQALDGPWKGKRLTPLPLLISFREAWQRFHPRTRWWQAG